MRTRRPPRLEQEHFTRLVATTTEAVVVGVGNVALDVARILAKHAEELAETDMADEVLDSLDHKQVSDVHVLGRRGPAYTAFTTKELRELGQIPDLDLLVDPLDLELDESSLAVVGRDKVAARNLVVLREWAIAPAAGRRDACTCTSGPVPSGSSAATGSRGWRWSGRRWMPTGPWSAGVSTG